MVALRTLHTPGRCAKKVAIKDPCSPRVKWQPMPLLRQLMPTGHRSPKARRGSTGTPKGLRATHVKISQKENIHAFVSTGARPNYTLQARCPMLMYENEGILSREVCLYARATCDLGRSASTHARPAQNRMTRLRAAWAVCKWRVACAQGPLRVQKRLRATR